MSAQPVVSENRYGWLLCRAPARALLVATLLALGCALRPCPVRARTQVPVRSHHTSTSVKLTEVVVTAQKRRQDIQSVPESVVAVDAEEIAARHITRIDQLSDVVPNLNITTRFDHTPDVVMRGVGAFGITQGVGFYANGVQLFDGQTVRMDDIERVEVLEGPQGVLYGGSNIGGAVKFVTKLPTDTLEYGGTVEYGEYATRTVSSFVSGPLVPESLDGRISAFYTRTGGYIYDPILGTNVDAGKEYGGRITLEHKSQNTTAILYIDADQLLTGAQNQYYRPSSATDYSYQVTDGTKPSFNRTLYSVTLRLEHNLTSSVKLVSISSLFHAGDGGITDVDKGPVPFLTAYQIFRHRVESEELRFLSSGAGPSKWLIGLFAQANDQPDNYTDSSSFNGDPANVASYSDSALYSDIFTNPRQTHREYAVFGNEEYDLDAWTFQGGARLDYNRSTMSDPLNGISASQRGSEFMPRASISYHFTPRVMTYAIVARGFEPGDLTEGANAIGAAEIYTYRPETDWSYEVGLKSTIANRVRLNGDVFYIDYMDRLYQTNRLELGQFVNVTTNIGSSRNYGAEMEMEALLGAGLKFNMSAGVTRAIWGNVPYYDADLSLERVNLSGRFAPNTPAYTLSSGFSWSRRLSEAAAVGARIDATAIGRSYWDPTNHYYQPAYCLVSAGAYLALGKWTVRAHGSNLLNTPYNTAFISAAEVGAPFDVAGIGRPRSWEISVSYDFY